MRGSLRSNQTEKNESIRQVNKRKMSVTVALLAVATGAAAHHAFEAEYDQKKLVIVSGAITKFEWTNPHAWIHLDARDERGRVTNWSFEMGAHGGLLNRGWKKGELKPGDQVTIDGYGSKHRASVANARMVTLPDGRKLFGGFQSTPGNPTGK